MNKRKFWNWTSSEDERVLRIDGVIAEESWLDDEITPKQFKSELMSGSGDITLWINSPGGDVIGSLGGISNCDGRNTSFDVACK